MAFLCWFYLLRPSYYTYVFSSYYTLKTHRCSGTLNLHTNANPLYLATGHLLLCLDSSHHDAWKPHYHIWILLIHHHFYQMEVIGVALLFVDVALSTPVCDFLKKRHQVLIIIIIIIIIIFYLCQLAHWIPRLALGNMQFGLNK